MSRLTLCTICARGGSKGVPGKNVKLLAGKPLVSHSIEQALATDLFAEIAVSSDSEQILDVAAAAGATRLIRRPDELASDTAPKIPAIRHCTDEVERLTARRFDIVVDLDVTSPLRTPQDIIAAHQLLMATDSDNVITATAARRSPYFNLVELDDQGYVHLSKPPATPVSRRQDSPRCFDMNASIYVWHRDALMLRDTVILERTRLYLMPEERSVDIDSPMDLAFVEFLLGKAASCK